VEHQKQDGEKPEVSLRADRKLAAVVWVCVLLAVGVSANEAQVTGRWGSFVTNALVVCGLLVQAGSQRSQGRSVERQFRLQQDSLEALRSQTSALETQSKTATRATAIAEMASLRARYEEIGKQGGPVRVTGGGGPGEQAANLRRQHQLSIRTQIQSIIDTNFIDKDERLRMMRAYLPDCGV
jgi:hypothetical protein